MVYSAVIDSKRLIKGIGMTAKMRKARLRKQGALLSLSLHYKMTWGNGWPSIFPAYSNEINWIGGKSQGLGLTSAG